MYRGAEMIYEFHSHQEMMDAWNKDPGLWDLHQAVRLVLLV